MTPAAAQVTFERYEVVTGSAQRQTVLTGFLLGGAIAELAVVRIDENDDRRGPGHMKSDTCGKKILPTFLAMKLD